MCVSGGYDGKLFVTDCERVISDQMSYRVTSQNVTYNTTDTIRSVNCVRIDLHISSIIAARVRSAIRSAQYRATSQNVTYSTTDTFISVDQLRSCDPSSEHLPSCNFQCHVIRHRCGQISREYACIHLYLLGIR